MHHQVSGENNSIWSYHQDVFSAKICVIKSERHHIVSTSFFSIEFLLSNLIVWCFTRSTNIFSESIWHEMMFSSPSLQVSCSRDQFSIVSLPTPTCTPVFIRDPMDDGSFYSCRCLLIVTYEIISYFLCADWREVVDDHHVFLFMHRNILGGSWNALEKPEAHANKRREKERERR